MYETDSRSHVCHLVYTSDVAIGFYSRPTGRCQDVLDECFNHRNHPDWTQKDDIYSNTNSYC